MIGNIIGLTDCRGCHGEYLDGKVSPSYPEGPNLSSVRAWSADQFITAMCTGARPSGQQLQPPMPWQTIGKFDDTELTAIYATSLPCRRARMCAWGLRRPRFLWRLAFAEWT